MRVSLEILNDGDLWWWKTELDGEPHFSGGSYRNKETAIIGGPYQLHLLLLNQHAIKQDKTRREVGTA